MSFPSPDSRPHLASSYTTSRECKRLGVAMGATQCSHGAFLKRLDRGMAEGRKSGIAGFGARSEFGCALEPKNAYFFVLKKRAPHSTAATAAAGSKAHTAPAGAMDRDVGHAAMRARHRTKQTAPGIERLSNSLRRGRAAVYGVYNQTLK